LTKRSTSVIINNQQPRDNPMPDNPRNPAGPKPLDRRAMLISQYRDGQKPTAAPGHNAAKSRTISLPQAAKPPSQPHQRLGRAVFHPNDEGAEKRQFTSRPSSREPSDAAQGEGDWATVLPRTRYRFGASLPGGRPSDPPPNPTLATRQNDPVRAAIGILRSITQATRTVAAQHAARPAGAEQSSHASGSETDPQQDQAAPNRHSEEA
jgi:hypothetical protein